MREIRKGAREGAREVKVQVRQLRKKGKGLSPEVLENADRQAERMASSVLSLESLEGGLKGKVSLAQPPRGLRKAF